MKCIYPVQSYISYSLATAHRKVHNSLTCRLKKFGVQVEAWRIMETLETDSDITMGNLANLVLMNAPTLTKLVDRMIADGFVHRRISNRDHRQVNLELTALGAKRIQQIREQALLEEQELTNKIGEKNIDLLRSILRDIGV